QIAYNNKLLESTEQTLFYANHGRHPNLFTRTLLSQKTEAAIATAKELKAVHKLLQSKLKTV
ncbi:hypothetical protein PTT_14432, partial [Pyrenophora teres f. teres 0-1]